MHSNKPKFKITELYLKDKVEFWSCACSVEKDDWETELDLRYFEVIKMIWNSLTKSRWKSPTVNRTACRSVLCSRVLVQRISLRNVNHKVQPQWERSRLIISLYHFELFSMPRLQMRPSLNTICFDKKEIMYGSKQILSCSKLKIVSNDYLVCKDKVFRFVHSCKT